MTHCGWGRYIPEDERMCDEPAIQKITVGCVHEHIDDGVFCKQHTNLILAKFNVKDVENLNCFKCASLSPDKVHACPVTLIKVETLDAVS